MTKSLYSVQKMYYIKNGKMITSFAVITLLAVVKSSAATDPKQNKMNGKKQSFP